MAVQLASVTFDSTDPVPLARWWAERFGAQITAENEGFFVLVAGGTLPAQLAFQKVDATTPGKNKLHLDVHTDDDLDVEVARWVDAGATVVERRSAGDFRWVTLSDPGGNEFCIAAG